MAMVFLVKVSGVIGDCYPREPRGVAQGVVRRWQSVVRPGAEDGPRLGAGAAFHAARGGLRCQRPEFRGH